MSQIRCMYEEEPDFPATDQHPNAQRYYVAGKIVDAIGEPTEAEVLAVLNPPKRALTTRERLERATGMTIAEIKAELAR